MNLEKSVLDMFEGLSKVDFNVIIKYSGFLFIVFWFVVAAWAWFDCAERSEKVYVRILVTLLVLFGNIPGLIIYLILRPKITIQDQYWSDLERRYLMYETAELQDCDKCGTMLQPGFVYCPNCKNEIKVKCSNCGVNIDKKWKNCPFCGDVNTAVVTTVVRNVRYESFGEFVSRKLGELKTKHEQRALTKQVTVKANVTDSKKVKEKPAKKAKRKNKNKK
ncbi:zinc ribbon domain-containing protein [Candidatus Dojkabacteria bacterium]|nr:zinc ribbon domain-containing protein [Candidatus Dojkabacteria bacterium]